MTQEEKLLLTKVLCAMSPYGVKIKVRGNDIRTVRAVDVVEGIVHFVESDSISPFGVHIEHPMNFCQVVKPYLRPMSEMTDEERNELYELTHAGSEDWTFSHNAYVVIDWLNSKHFDYCGLIPKGLALKAKENMYRQDSV